MVNTNPGSAVTSNHTRRQEPITLGGTLKEKFLIFDHWRGGGEGGMNCVFAVEYNCKYN